MNKILLVAAMLVLYFVVQAQKASHKGGSQSGAASMGGSGSNSNTSSTSTSGTNQIEQGYHYRLPLNYHIQYLAFKDSTYDSNTKKYQYNYDTSDRYWHTIASDSPYHRFAKAVLQWPWKWFTGGNWRLPISIVQDNDTGRLKLQFLRLYIPKLSTVTNRACELNIKTRNPTDCYTALPISPADSAENFYIQLTKRYIVGDYTWFLSLPYSTWQLGATTIPFKYRRARKIGNVKDSIPNDLSTNINIALYLAKKWGRTRFYYDQAKTHNTISFMLSVFAGPTQIQLSGSNTTDNAVKTTNQLGGSFGLAFSAEISSVSFGLFFGKDLSFGNAIDWFYNHRTWIGFGIGVNLAMFNAAQSK
jgi:hypothetical protein